MALDLYLSVQRIQADLLHDVRREVAAMQHVLALVDLLKDHHVNVLLTGESGTGKDLIARTLHYYSSRKHAPFVPVNCMEQIRFPAEVYGRPWYQNCFSA